MAKRLQNILEQDIYSKVDLGAQPSWVFFNGSDNGVDENGNIDQKRVIDANSDFQCNYIDVNIMRTAGEPLETAQIALIGSLLRESWINFQTNSTDKLWGISLSGMIKAPMAVAAAGASAYDPKNIVYGTKAFRIPLMLYGGQNTIVSLNRRTTTNYTGLTVEMILVGIIDRSKVVAKE